MAPEVENTEIPKTNRVDIWSLGCVLYRMLTGSRLFPNPHGLYRYTFSKSSPPPEVKNAGFSDPCVNFLGDVLQPEPEDRPSAEDCMKKAWITDKASSSEYTIGRELYSRLSEIERAAPSLGSLADTVVNLAVGVYGESPALKASYEIGRGAFGTVFLKKVQTRGMESPELWAVKRIPRDLPHFPTMRYQAEIRNLRALSSVSFAQTCPAPQQALVSFDLWEVLSDVPEV